MRDYRKLRVWAAGHALTLDVYRETAAFPFEERFGLKSQLRRSAAAIGSNIAEGAGRSTQADFARFVDIAIGSASELEYQLLLCRDLGLIGVERYEELDTSTRHLRRALSRFSDRLKSSD